MSPRGVLRRALSILSIIVLAASGCGRDDPRPLEERLKALFGESKSDLTPNEVQQALTRELRTPPVPSAGQGSRSNPPFPTRETLRDFYRKHGHRFAWCDDSGEVLPRARTFLDALRRAGEHGLDSEDYALSRLDDLESQIGKARTEDTASRLADFDLLMTAAFLRYASDVATGRIHPDEVRDDWHTNAPELDLVGGLDRALDGEDLSRPLGALPPPHTGYARLREALKALREVEAKGGWPTVPDGPKLVPGSRGPRVALLRQRLAETDAPGRSGAGDQFDTALAESVRRFQERHGIEPDGNVGDRTLAELNVPAGRRIRQVELNLERWRWIPRRLGDPCVVVNIPAFGLEVVRNGSRVWRTRIVVGKAYTQTPVFSDRIVGVLANPPWNVPDSIAVGEYLPELRMDPRALERHGLRLFEGSGEKAREVDPRTVDWKRMEEKEFHYSIRQDPGPENALGRLKFELTNDFHIYLHDTPSSHLFGRSDRGLSHGCIRVERPLELAVEILGRPARDSLREALDQAEERRLPVKPPVPVHIFYWTAWVDESGFLCFGPDLYDFDGAQMAALKMQGSRLAEGSPAGAK